MPSKLPTPDEIASNKKNIYPDWPTHCVRMGAHAMAEAIRDEMRKSAKAHRARDGGAFLRASWAMEGFADLIDDALRDAPA